MKNLASPASLSPSTSTRPPASKAAESGVVLFAIFEHGRPTPSLLRALALCRVLNTKLHVVRVLPEASRVNALFPERNIVDVVGMFERNLRAERTARDWLASVHGEDVIIEQTVVVHGDFVEQVCAKAAAVKAVLIVVPPREGRMGSTVTSLARKSNVPVLVARAPQLEETIVAATDLESADYPVLRKAAELGSRLDAPVVAVHNISPVAAVVGFDMAWPMIVPAEAAVRHARSTELTEISATLPTLAQAVIRQDVSSVDAIVDEAHVQHADIVVVGTRRRGWFERWFVGSVAAQVVNHAAGSVLVMPLDDDDYAP